MRHLAILCVKNEAAFLLEWLAHHRVIGFDHFLVFSNDCEDGTDKMLDHIAQKGWLTHIRNDGPYDNRGIQFTALQQAATHPTAQLADWILPIDIDEFVNIHCGNHTLDALHAAVPEATAITLTWRLFGSNQQTRYRDRMVTEQFTRAAPKVMHWPWRAAMFKTLYRNDGTYAKPGIHRPRTPDQQKLAQAHWVDGNGKILSELFHTKRIFSNFGQDNYGLVQLNHYPLGAMESYILKADRGRAVHGDDQLGMDYWVERNFNIDRDISIDTTGLERKEELGRLREDPTLARLHHAAVAWRKARFDELMAQEPYRALFGRLLMTPSSTPVSQDAAGFLLSQAKRSQNG